VVVVNYFIFVSFLKIREPLSILYPIRQFLVLMIDKIMCERKLCLSRNQKVDKLSSTVISQSKDSGGMECIF